MWVFDRNEVSWTVVNIGDHPLPRKRHCDWIETHVSLVSKSTQGILKIDLFLSHVSKTPVFWMQIYYFRFDIESLFKCGNWKLFPELPIRSFMSEKGTIWMDWHSHGCIYDVCAVPISGCWNQLLAICYRYLSV